MRFLTTVLDADGATVRQELEAADAQSLHAELHRQGRTLLAVESLDEEFETDGVTDVALGPRRLLLLTQALAEALEAGVPLLSTFHAMADQEQDDRTAELLEDVAARVEAGQVLSDAMAAHPMAFPPVYCALVRAGEQSGSLPRVLTSIAGFLEWRLEITGVVKQAMVYPIVVAVAGYAMLLFLLSFVIPRLGAVLSKIGGELPTASRMLIASSDFVANHILAVVGLSLASALGAVLALRTHAVRTLLAKVAAGLPVLRTVVATLSIAQFCRTFGVLLQAGLTMTHALELAAASVASPRFAETIDTVRRRILGGERLVDVASDVDLLPPVALSMVRVGEEAGRLPVTFERLGRLYDREVKAVVKRALGLMEPIVTVLLGVVVGGIAVLVVTTIYSAMKGLGR
ncbi:MAG: type II secretion system F family protein [Planctomycetes bacterium]|nr:type II secretion system F family protein [Planctomycetota bacterium]